MPIVDDEYTGSVVLKLNTEWVAALGNVESVSVLS